MANQQQNDTRTPSKGAPGNPSPNPQQGGQKAGQDSQHRRDAHTNSSAAGKDSGSSQRADLQDDDDMRAQHSSTRNLETEPDRARQQK